MFEAIPTEVPAGAAPVSSVKVLLGDDDAGQLGLLADLLARLRPHWSIVACARSADEVQHSLDQDRPTLAILDVRLGAVTALEIVRQQSRRVPTIFVTGDPIFAVDAFNSDAVDFVLKPVRAARLEQALAKAEASTAMPSVPAGRERTSALCLFRGQELVWAPLDEVVYFTADRKYTRVVMPGFEGLLRMGIGAVESSLDPQRFWRIHRGIIVNMRHMDSARRDDLGRLVVRLRDRAERLVVSRPNESRFTDGFF